MRKHDDENTALLGSGIQVDTKDDHAIRPSHRRPAIRISLVAFVVLTVSMIGFHFYSSRSQSLPTTASPLSATTNLEIVKNDSVRLSPPYIFPPNFTWGAATSSYQVEGAVKEDGRGRSIWDAFCEEEGTIMDGSNADVTCDHYHRVVNDVALMKTMNLKAYRFSISWPRIMPSGVGPVNSKGITFYSHLIDLLIENGIEPWVTLFHWDLPDALYQNYGGWLDRNNTVVAFGEYARICFRAFGDRVQRWVTINEAWTVAVNGHGTGIHAPGHQSDTEPYIVGHNLLLAHATAAHIYHTEFAPHQEGMIGIANCGDFRYPLTPRDYEAAQRAMLFKLGWFTEPLFFGKYPSVMEKRLGSRLPEFSEQDRELVRGSADFVGLNYYSALQVSTPKEKASYQGYWADIDTDFHFHPDWEKNDMGWGIVPDGLREMLFWLSNRYGRPIIYTTENGSAEPEPNVLVALQDEKRRKFIEGHVRACAQAIEGGVDLRGYFAWSFMDNFEWQFGYQRRFGMYRVDFDTLERTPKSSAVWYNDTIQNHGRNIPRMKRVSWYPWHGA